MARLIIWGAGGHGKVVLDVARATGAYDEIAFVDDACALPETVFCNCRLLSVSPGIDLLSARGFRRFVVAIGDNRLRARCFEEAIARGFVPATLVHPSAIVSSSACVDNGTVVMPRVVVNAGAMIGRNCIVNTAAIVEHDCLIGDHVHIAPTAVLGGGVTVEPRAMVGLGSVALPGAVIGEGAIVGAGAVVLNSVPSGATVAGVPARVLSRVGQASSERIR